MFRPELRWQLPSRERSSPGLKNHLVAHKPLQRPGHISFFLTPGQAPVQASRQRGFTLPIAATLRLRGVACVEPSASGRSKESGWGSGRRREYSACSVFRLDSRNCARGFRTASTMAAFSSAMERADVTGHGWGLPSYGSIGCMTPPCGIPCRQARREIAARDGKVPPTGLQAFTISRAERN